MMRRIKRLATDIEASSLHMSEVLVRLLSVAFMAERLPVLGSLDASIRERNDVIDLRPCSGATASFAASAERLEAKVLESYALQLPTSNAVRHNERARPLRPGSRSLSDAKGARIKTSLTRTCVCVFRRESGAR